MTHRKGPLGCGWLVVLALVTSNAYGFEHVGGTFLEPVNGIVIGTCKKCLGNLCFNKPNSGKLCDSGACGGDCAVALAASASLDLKADLSLSGRVIDTGMNPISNRIVRLELPTGEELRTVTDDQGCWKLFIETTSGDVASVDVGDTVLDPDNPDDEVRAILVQCPAAGVCW